jgi:putative membrane protein
MHATAPGTTISTPEFVSKAIESNMFEVQSARLAEQRGDRQEANFARQAVRDHTKATDDLKAMVNSGKVNARIPTALDAQRQQKLAQLQNFWGSSFDRTYGQDQRQLHQNEIDLFQRYTQNGDNPALKQWAAKMLPELKSGLVVAQMLG